MAAVSGYAFQALDKNFVVLGDRSNNPLAVKTIGHCRTHRIVNLVEDKIGLDSCTFSDLPGATGHLDRLVIWIDNAKHQIAVLIDLPTEVLQSCFGVDKNDLIVFFPQAGKHGLGDTADHTGTAFTELLDFTNHQQLDPVCFGQTFGRQIVKGEDLLEKLVFMVMICGLLKFLPCPVCARPWRPS